MSPKHRQAIEHARYLQRRGILFSNSGQRNEMTQKEFRDALTKAQSEAKLEGFPLLCKLLKGYNIYQSGYHIDKWEFYYHHKRNFIEAAHKLIEKGKLGTFSIKSKSETTTEF